VYRGLFHFVAGVSALALLAGVVLIANAVGLALVERRRELAVLKAVGYRRFDVLGLIAVENMVLGSVAGAAGVGGVYLAIAGINMRQPGIHLSLSAAQATALVLVSIILAAGTAVCVAWRSTGRRPMRVLREE
jgi:putative ABC transport system permease protein